MFGPQIDRFKNVRDVTRLEMVPIAVLVIAILVVGIYPAVISDFFAEGLSDIVDAVQTSSQLAMR